MDASTGQCFNEAAGIPRGRPTRRLTTPSARSRFNEAAGIPRGRRTWFDRRTCSHRRFNEAAGIPRGRPADYINTRLVYLLASMRPRVFPAEDLRRGGRGGFFDNASMRPRVFPAEDAPATCRPRRRTSRFNEAAGIPRGRPQSLQSLAWLQRRFNEAAGIPRGRRCKTRVLEVCYDAVASMRPRVFPAEDLRRRVREVAACWLQ